VKEMLLATGIVEHVSIACRGPQHVSWPSQSSCIQTRAALEGGRAAILIMLPEDMRIRSRLERLLLQHEVLTRKTAASSTSALLGLVG